MQRLAGIIAAAALAFSLAAQPSQAADKPQPKVQTINGYLVDVACATENAEKPKPGFAAKHDKSCLQMPDCVPSGYSIVTDDNKVIKFDKNGTETAKKLIAATDKKDDWKISVTGVVDGDTITVQSLTLQ